MRPSPVAAMRAYLIGLIGLFVYSAMMSALADMGIRMGFLSYIINIIFQWLVFALPALLYYQKRPELQPSLRLFPLDPACVVVIVAASAVGMLALNWLSLYWVMILSSLGFAVDTGGELISKNGTELIWFLVYGALAPAAFEEVLFRGFLFPAFETKGRRAAILLSALLFALLHGSVEALPAHILLGIILSLLMLKTGSLYAPMVYHAAHNGAVMLLGYYWNDPADATEALPTAGEAVGAIPGVLILLLFWGFLLAFVFRRGEQKGGERLPPAEPARLPKPAKIMLFAAAVILLGFQIVTVLGMLAA